MSRPQPARRPRSRDTLAACRQRGSRLKTARPVAVEMTRRGKRGKLQRQKRVFPSFLRAWKSGKKPKRRISTFPQRRRRLSRTKRKAENRLSKSNILKLQDDSSKVTFLNCLTGRDRGAALGAQHKSWGSTFLLTCRAPSWRRGTSGQTPGGEKNLTQAAPSGAKEGRAARKLLPPLAGLREDWAFPLPINGRIVQ